MRAIRSRSVGSGGATIRGVGMGDVRESDGGQSIIALLVGLMISSFVLLFATLLITVVVSEGVNATYRMRSLDSLLKVEDFLRKEISRLRFSPYCPALLPAYHKMSLGEGIDMHYRERLRESIIIYRQVAARKRAVNIASLKGQGVGRYDRMPIKNLSGIVEGSDMTLITGLIPTALAISSYKIHGVLTEDLVGVRSMLFYLTDCSNSLLVRGKRVGDYFELNPADVDIVNSHLDSEVIHIYALKEYFIYLQLNAKEPFFVVDYLDGQAFLRVPYIVDVRFGVLDSDAFEAVLVSGVKAQMGTTGHDHNNSHDFGRDFAIDAYGVERIYQNAEFIDLRPIRIIDESYQ